MSTSPDVDALYLAHHAWLKGWLRRKLGCSHRAADLAHGTFVRVLVARIARPIAESCRN